MLTKSVDHLRIYRYCYTHYLSKDSCVKKIPWRRERLPTPVFWASLVAQLVKNLPVMQETWVQSLGWEDPLEKGKASHSRILESWRIPWTI